MKMILLGVGLLLVLVQSGTALRCYQCRSHKQSDCGYNGHLARATECPYPASNMVSFCIYKETYDSQLQAPTYVSSCGTQQSSYSSSSPSAIEQQQCQSSGKEQIRQCRVCMNDLCNTGSNSPQSSGSNYNPNGPNYNPSGSSYNPNSPNYNPNNPSYNPNNPSYNPNNPSYNPNNPSSPNYNPSAPNYNPNGPSHIYPTLPNSGHGGNYPNSNSNYRPNNDQYRSGEYNSNNYRSGDHNSDTYRAADYNADPYRSSSYDSSRRY